MVVCGDVVLVGGARGVFGCGLGFGRFVGGGFSVGGGGVCGGRVLPSCSNPGI